MRVDWAIPCRYVEVQQHGATIVGAGADLAFIPQVPAGVQMLFAVRFVGAPDELDGETKHSIGCRIFDPRGTQVGEQMGEITGVATQILPGYVAEVTVPMGVIIDAREFGSYAVEFAIDDETRRVPVHILETPDEPA